MPTETRLALAYRFKELEAEKAKERKLANLKQFLEAENAETEVSQLTDSLPVGSREDTTKGKTLEIIAQKAGVSRATAEQYDAIQRKGTDEQKAEVVEGNKVIKRFLDSIKKVEFNRDTERKYPSLKLCTYVRSWEVLSIYKKAGF